MTQIPSNSPNPVQPARHPAQINGQDSLPGQTIESERMRVTTSTPDDVAVIQDQFESSKPRSVPMSSMPARASGLGWSASDLQSLQGDNKPGLLSRFSAFLGKDQVTPTKPSKIQLTENIWVSPAEVMAQPAWRKLWEDREKQVLQKDATINGLLAAGTAGFFGSTICNHLNLLNPAHGPFLVGLGLLGFPIVLASNAIMKWDKLDGMRPDHPNTPPPDPEESESVTLTKEEVDALQQQFAQLQQQQQMNTSTSTRRA